MLPSLLNTRQCMNFIQVKRCTWLSSLQSSSREVDCMRDVLFSILMKNCFWLFDCAVNGVNVYRSDDRKYNRQCVTSRETVTSAVSNSFWLTARVCGMFCSLYNISQNQKSISLFKSESIRNGLSNFQEGLLLYLTLMRFLTSSKKQHSSW